MLMGPGCWESPAPDSKSSSLRTHTHIPNGHASAHKPQVVCPGITTPVTRLVKAFIVCARHNPGKVVKTPQKVTPKLLYPFQRLQMDFTQLPKNGT
uniref:Uncharacterized protein n=1 Tax=Engystomops pustulosus TaxID=76066 RepID=A0AAV6YQB4_ENGPU|nr:hypothetical protein GDO81_021981 [Engystomops pustulosus]